jgi:multidrug transporter EmrE-like cation transporter
MLVYFWLAASALAFAAGEYASKQYINSDSMWWAMATYVAYNLGVMLWFPALRQRNELAIVGTVWSLMSMIATVLIGVAAFHEHLSTQQIAGISLALVAMALLSM